MNQPPSPAGATFTVKSTADTVDANPGDSICADNCGNCTLRAAIMEANAFSGDDTIDFDSSVFSVPQTITLTIPGVNEDFNATGDLDITSDLTITGAGANLTTINAGGIDRVFEIRPVNTTNVRISGLTATGGKTLQASPGGGSGGGILAHGTLLTLTNVTVSGNTADYGGGIFVGGPVTLNNCTVSGNSGYAGGGINNYINGPLILNNSTVSGNSAGYGGGIADSNYGPTLTLNNSTVAGNTTPNGVGMGLRSHGTVILKNTILANTAGLYGNCDVITSPPFNGNLISLGHNLSTDTSCQSIGTGGLNQPTDLNNTPAQLAPLALNLPGSTQTHALCTGPGTPHASCGAVPSPAIDKGGDCLAVDQRGVPRPQGAGCDIGAYEVGTGPNACTTPPPNMVAWWPLDGLNASGEYDDWAGGDNNGTPLGNPSPIPSQYVGNSLQAGTGKYVRVTDAPNLNFGLGSFTIDAWVKYAPGTQTEPIVYKLANPSGSGGGYSLSIVKANSQGTQKKLQLQIATKVYPGPIITATQGTWIFVAATVNKTPSAGIVNLYVGVPNSPLAITNNPAGAFNASRPGTPLLIGRWQGNPHAGLGIDEVEIFNRALTQQPEIQSIYDARSAGKCKQEDKGMTWVHRTSNAQNGTINVGCSGCDAANGDTVCSQQLPVLCIYKPAPAFQLPVGLNNSDQYNRWSGGVVATTPPVAGSTFANSAAVNAYCQAQFGPGWRVAEFHDGWGWNFQAYGGTVSAPTVPSTRFWVYINDQLGGNCWQP